MRLFFWSSKMLFYLLLICISLFHVNNLFASAKKNKTNQFEAKYVGEKTAKKSVSQPRNPCSLRKVLLLAVGLTISSISFAQANVYPKFKETGEQNPFMDTVGDLPVVHHFLRYVTGLKYVDEE